MQPDPEPAGLDLPAGNIILTDGLLRSSGTVNNFAHFGKCDGNIGSDLAFLAKSMGSHPAKEGWGPHRDLPIPEATGLLQGHCLPFERLKIASVNSRVSATADYVWLRCLSALFTSLRHDGILRYEARKVKPLC